VFSLITRSGRATRNTVRAIYLFIPSHANVAPDEALLPPSLFSQLHSITRDDLPPRHLSRWAARYRTITSARARTRPACARRLFAAQNGNGRTTMPSAWANMGRRKRARRSASARRSARDVPRPLHSARRRTRRRRRRRMTRRISQSQAKSTSREPTACSAAGSARACSGARWAAARAR
jgi:hypothetical protein